MKMKTVVIANQWSRAGGLEIVTQDEVRALCDLGFDVTVIPASGNGVPGRHPYGAWVEWLNIPTFRPFRSIWYRFLRLRVIAQRVERILGEDGGLVIFGHAILLPALRYFKHPERYKKWVWTHGVDAWGWLAWRWLPYMNQLDRVIAVSKYTAWHEHCAGVTVPISVVPNSIDIHRFVPTTTPEKVRHDEVMICGRITSVERYKGHDQLLEAMPIVEKLVGRKISLRVVGKGDDLPRLKEKARSLGIADRVIFTGFVTDAELLEAYQHCGVFAMPSRAEPRPKTKDWAGEGFGLVYAEAEACARPVVVSTDGGAPETLVDGETGYLADPRDPQAIATAIAKVIKDSAVADEMGRRGCAFVNKTFSFERFRDNVKLLLQKEGFEV